MVKLFVGNLADNIDPHKLRQIFTTHIRVTECDVIKNYAFVHVDDSDDGLVDDVVARLNGYVLEGRAITLERSTSKLRTKPGMQDKCFRCGDVSHKTPQCPFEPKKPEVVETIKIDLTGQKRSAIDSNGAPDSKRLALGGAGIDQELSKPIDPELMPLYNQYIDSRNRYTYYRDRLIKETQARSLTVSYTTSQQQMLNTASAVSAEPVTYGQPTAVPQWQASTTGGSAPYQMGLTQQLKAPYATATAQQVTQPVVSYGQPQPIIQQQPVAYAQPAQTMVTQQPGQPGVYGTTQMQTPQPLMQYQQPQTQMFQQQQPQTQMLQQQQSQTQMIQQQQPQTQMLQQQQAPGQISSLIQQPAVLYQQPQQQVPQYALPPAPLTAPPAPYIPSLMQQTSTSPAPAPYQQSHQQHRNSPFSGVSSMHSQPTQMGYGTPPIQPIQTNPSQTSFGRSPSPLPKPPVASSPWMQTSLMRR